MLKRKRIHGISFHHRAPKRSKNEQKKIQDFFNLEDLYRQAKNDMPKPLSYFDIRRLLSELGRNEINSRIAQSIDFLSKWTAIFKVISRCFPEKEFSNTDLFTFSAENANLVYFSFNEVELYLQVKKLIWILKHNLNILEMIAGAQHFLT